MTKDQAALHRTLKETREILRDLPPALLETDVVRMIFSDLRYNTDPAIFRPGEAFVKILCLMANPNVIEEIIDSVPHAGIMERLTKETQDTLSQALERLFQLTTDAAKQILRDTIKIRHDFVGAIGKIQDTHPELLVNTSGAYPSTYGREFSDKPIPNAIARIHRFMGKFMNCDLNSQGFSVPLFNEDGELIEAVASLSRSASEDIAEILERAAHLKIDDESIQTLRTIQQRIGQLEFPASNREKDAMEVLKKSPAAEDTSLIAMLQRCAQTYQYRVPEYQPPSWRLQ